METAGSDSGKACLQGSGAPTRRKRAAPEPPSRIQTASSAPPPPAAVDPGPPQAAEAFGDDAEGRRWWTDTWLSAAAARTDDTGSEASVPSILDLPDAGLPETLHVAQPKRPQGSGGGPAAGPGAEIGSAVHTQTANGAGARKRRAPAPPPASPAAAPPANPAAAPLANPAAAPPANPAAAPLANPAAAPLANPAAAPPANPAAAPLANPAAAPLANPAAALAEGVTEGDSLSTLKPAPPEWAARPSGAVHHDTERWSGSETDPDKHRRDERALVKPDARMTEDVMPTPSSAVERAGESARRPGVAGSSQAADWLNPLAAGSVTSRPRARQPPPPAPSPPDSEYDDLDIDEALFAMVDVRKPQRKRRAPPPPRQNREETVPATQPDAALPEQKLRENHSTHLQHSAPPQQKPSSSSQLLSLEDRETPLPQGLQHSVPPLQQLEGNSPLQQQLQCDSPPPPEKSVLQARQHRLNDETSSSSTAALQEAVSVEAGPRTDLLGMRDSDTREEHPEVVPEACVRLGGTDVVDDGGLESETPAPLNEDPVRDKLGMHLDLQPVSRASSSSSALSEPIPPPRPSLSFKVAMESVSVSAHQLDSDLERLEPDAKSTRPQKADEPGASTERVRRVATPPLPLQLVSGPEAPEVGATLGPDLSGLSPSPQARLSMSKSLSLQLMHSVGEYRAMTSAPEPADDAANVSDSSGAPDHNTSGRAAGTGGSTDSAAAPADDTAHCADLDACADAFGSFGREDSDRSSNEAVHCSSMPNCSVGRVKPLLSGSSPPDSPLTRTSRMVKAGSLDAFMRERNNNCKAIIRDSFTEENLENVALLRHHESPSPLFKTPENHYSESTNATTQSAKLPQMLLPSATVHGRKPQNEYANVMATPRERTQSTAGPSSRSRDPTPERRGTPPPPRATVRRWTPPRVQLGAWSGYKSSIQLMEDSDYVLHTSAQRRSPIADPEAAAGLGPQTVPPPTEAGEGAHPARLQHGGDTAAAADTRVPEQTHGTAAEPPGRRRARLKDADGVSMPWDGGVSERLKSDDFWTRVPAQTLPEIRDLQLGAAGPQQLNSDSTENSSNNQNAWAKPFVTGSDNYVVSALRRDTGGPDVPQRRRDTGGSDVPQRGAAGPSMGGSERLLIGNGAGVGRAEAAPTGQTAQPTAQTVSKPLLRLPPHQIWVNRYQPVVKGFRSVTAPRGPNTAEDSSEV